MQHPPRNITVQCFDWQKLILQQTDMPPNAKYLALYLGSYMNINRDVAWPSLKTISRETELAESTVTKWLDFLVSEGWLIKQSGNRTESNRYWINVPNEVPRSLGYPDEQEKVPRQSGSNNNRITNTTTTTKRMPKPSLQDVVDYVTEKNYIFDPEHFWNYYESQGWKVGRNPMKDWKRACVTWQKKEEQRTNGNPQGHTGQRKDSRRLSPGERVRAAAEQRAADAAREIDGSVVSDG